MKHEKAICVILAAFMFLAAFPALFAGCSRRGENGRRVVYGDMLADFERSGMRASNIGIFSRSAAAAARP